MREKLIELLGKATSACVGTDCFEGCKYYAENDCRYKLMADALIANGVTVTDNNVGGKINIRFKDFEIRPTTFLDGHKDPTKFDVVKWQKHEPIEVYNLSTGKKEMSDSCCFSIAHIYWNEKEPCWEFESVGTRFLKYYEEGLCEFVREWIELIGEPKGE